MPRLNEALIANERYRGEPSTDDEGRTQWPIRIIWDDELPGFGVRIHPPVRGKPSRKDFIVSWKVGLKSRTMGIGTFGVDCTLRQARKVAREAIDLARRGQDPIEARHRALGIGTAEDLASRFLFEHSAAKRKGPVPGDAAVTPGATPDPEPAESVDPAASPAVAATLDAATAAATTPSADASADDAVAAADPAASGTVDPGVAASGVTSTREPTATAADLSTPRAAYSEPAASDGLASDPADAAEALDAEEDDSVSAVEAPAAAESHAKETSGAPAAPPPVSAPRIGETRRAAAPAPKRGPTKVRLLPVPDSLYRVIETGARESEMTIAAYLNALIEIARAALGEDGAEAGASDDAPESAPAIKELFSQVQEAQAVEVGGSSADDRDPERGPRRG